MLGHSECLACSAWPEVDAKALVVEVVPVVLQINGKLREQFEYKPGLSAKELEAKVLAEPATQKRLEGKQVIKVIAVPNKLVNIVVRD